MRGASFYDGGFNASQWPVATTSSRTFRLSFHRNAVAPRHCRVSHSALLPGALAAITSRPVLPVVKSWLSEEQQSWVERYAPERIDLPGGRKAKIIYSADNPPTLSARIQDLYGVKEGLWIANRRVPLRIQILAPSNRPVQITENLSTFWRDTYPKLKEELKRRYPKHEWR